MQRRDFAIVLVGVVIVVAATVYAASVDGDSAFDVTFQVVHHETDLKPTGSGAPVGAFTVTATRNVTAVNLSLVHFDGRVTSGTTFPPTATLHASLLAPNGSKLEKDVSVSPGASEMDFEFDVPLAKVPANLSTRAADASHALSSLPGPIVTGQGVWTLSVSVSQGAPNVVPFMVNLRASEDSFLAAAAASSPVSK